MIRIGTSILVGVCLMVSVALGANEVVVTSPQGDISATVSVSPEGQLSYRVTSGDAAVIETSPLGVTVDGVTLGRGVSIGNPSRRSRDESYRSVGGVHAMARNHFNGGAIPVTHKATGTSYVLEVRAFDDGIGLRYIVEGRGKRRVPRRPCRLDGTRRIANRNDECLLQARTRSG